MEEDLHIQVSSNNSKFVEERQLEKGEEAETSFNVDIKTEVIEIESDDDEDCVEAPGFILEYPGKKEEKCQGSIQIFMEDIQCLAPTRYLNDKMIDFWMNYIYLQRLSSQEKKSIHIYSSLFYNSIENQYKSEQKSKEVGRRTKYLPNIFKKEFIFIPISLEAHWVLAVICYPGHVLPHPVSPAESVKGRGIKRRKANKSGILSECNESEENESSGDEYHPTSRPDLSSVRSTKRRKKYFREPKKIKKETEEYSPIILIFDSFKSYGVDKAMIGQRLRSFLTAEWKHENGVEMNFDSENLPLAVPKVPQQENFHDCGLFVLEFFEAFFSKRITHFQRPLPDMSDWFSISRTDEKREEIYRSILLILSKRYSSKLSFLPLTVAELDNLEGMDTHSCQSPDLFADEGDYDPEEFSNIQVQGSSIAICAGGEKYNFVAGSEDRDVAKSDEEDAVESEEDEDGVVESEDEDTVERENEDAAEKDDGRLSERSEESLSSVESLRIKRTKKTTYGVDFGSESDDSSVDSDEYVDLIVPCQAEEEYASEREVEEEVVEKSEEEEDEEVEENSEGEEEEEVEEKSEGEEEEEVEEKSEGEEEEENVEENSEGEEEEEVEEKAEGEKEEEGFDSKEESERQEEIQSEINDDATREGMNLPNFVHSPRSRFAVFRRRRFGANRNRYSQEGTNANDEMLLYCSPPLNI